MERDGILIDPPYFSRQAKKADEKAKEKEEGLNVFLRGMGVEPINWRSPQQKVKLFHETLKLPVSPVCGKGKTKKGKAPTDHKAVEWLRDYSRKRNMADVSAALDKAIDLQRCHSSIKYLKKFPLHADKNGYIHCSMAPDTSTFRLAARCPELQQVPIRKEKDEFEIRKGFIAPEGRSYLVADQSQLEMRIISHLLIKMYGDYSLHNDILAADCHSANAIRVFGRVYSHKRISYVDVDGNFHEIFIKDLPPQYLKKHPDPFVSGLRDDIKSVAYGLNYGMTEHSLGARLKDENGEPIGSELASQIISAYLDLYPGLRKFFAFCKQFVRKHAGMYTLLGRFRNIPDGLDSRDWVVDKAARIAANVPEQGGGAEIVTLWMLLIEHDTVLRKLEFSQRLQIHDEIDGYCWKGTEEECCNRVADLGTTCFELLTPLVCEPGTGESWHDAK